MTKTPVKQPRNFNVLLWQLRSFASTIYARTERSDCSVLGDVRLGEVSRKPHDSFAPSCCGAAHARCLITVKFSGKQTDSRELHAYTRRCLVFFSIYIKYHVWSRVENALQPLNNHCSGERIFSLYFYFLAIVDFAYPKRIVKLFAPAFMVGLEL